MAAGLYFMAFALYFWVIWIGAEPESFVHRMPGSSGGARGLSFPQFPRATTAAQYNSSALEAGGYLSNSSSTLGSAAMAASPIAAAPQRAKAIYTCEFFRMSPVVLDLNLTFRLNPQTTRTPMTRTSCRSQRAKFWKFWTARGNGGRRDDRLPTERSGLVSHRPITSNFFEVGHRCSYGLASFLGSHGWISDGVSMARFVLCLFSFTVDQL
jgi:hypothetical protein